MKRTIILALCMVITAMGLTAQKNVEARIKQIRQAYANRINMMNNQPYDDVKVEQMTISYNRIYPGTGLYRYTDTYYWTDDENEDYMLKPTLYFVTRKYSLCHDIYRHYHEYLFDAETGEPMFLYITTQMGDDENTKQEFRFYIDKGKLIKQIPERIGPFDDSNFIPPGIGIDENGRALNIIGEFNGVLDTFDMMIPTYAW